MLLANWCLPRRRDTIEVIGAALTAHAAGPGRRRLARRLGVPDSTVRGWLRRARTRTDRLRIHATLLAHANDPLLPAIEPTANSFDEAVEALGTASSAIRLRRGYDTPSGWSGIVALTHGRLLARR